MNAPSLRHRLRVIVPVVLLAALAAWGGTTYLARRSAGGAVEGSGTIEAEQVTVASKVPGRIERIAAGEGDVVAAGAILVTVEGRELAAQADQVRAALDVARARRQQAQAALDLAERQMAATVRQAEAVLSTARANAAAAKAQLDRATGDLARLEPLYKEGAIGAQQIDAARTARDAATAQHEAARLMVQQAEAALQNARAAEAVVAQRRADIAAARAQVAQAEATVRLLQAQVDSLTITSPITGVVLAKHASAGEVVGAGTPILTVGNLDEVWIRLFVPLPHLGRVDLGQQARVTTDALPGRVFNGAVTEISQQAEFTPRNVQTKEERVKLVYAVKVTLPNPDHALKPGMPADAVLVAGE